MKPGALLRTAASIANYAADTLEGKPPSPAELVAVLFGAASALGVTVELHEYLTQEARARVDAEIDAKLDEPGT